MFTFVVLCMLETYLTPKLILNTNGNIKKKKKLKIRLFLKKEMKMY